MIKYAKKGEKMALRVLGQVATYPSLVESGTYIYSA